jgi:hypothetical protein
MALLIWVLAIICVVLGVVRLIQGAILWGVVLIVVGLILGGGFGFR